MSGAGMLRLQMILKIRVAEAPVVMIAAHSAHGISAAVLAALIAAVLAGIAVVEAQAAVLAEVIRIVSVHCAHSLGSVMCGGGSVYGVFTGGGKRKSRCAVSGGLCACGHCGGERYHRGAYG